MLKRFEHVEFDKEAASLISELEVHAQKIRMMIIVRIREGGQISRPASNALTRLDECCMWIGEAVLEAQEIRRRSQEQE
jgi:hypothetical protein